MKLTVAAAPESLSRVKPATRQSIKVGLVQFAWRPDISEHLDNLERGVRLAAEAGAALVCLPELTLMRYPADSRPIATSRPAPWQASTTRVSIRSASSWRSSASSTSPSRDFASSRDLSGTRAIILRQSTAARREGAA